MSEEVDKMKVSIDEFENMKLETREDWENAFGNDRYIDIHEGPAYEKNYSVILRKLKFGGKFLTVRVYWWDKVLKTWVSDGSMRATYGNMKDKIIKYWHE